MCANYRPTARDLLQQRFGVKPPADDYKPECWPGYLAPIIRPDGQGGRECVLARFGLIPPWARDTAIARKTYNARVETVAEKPSFKHAWRHGQFCLVPMEAFYEPSWESGKAVRWRIGMSDAGAFAVAALWERWRNPASGSNELSFSMLTLNADSHSLMRRFHRPEDEKRMVTVLPPDEYDNWLHATADFARTFAVPFPAEAMSAEAQPLPPRRRAAR